MMVTKGITVRQPWARCITVGAKTVENRGRSTSYRGLVAIHAGKTPDLFADQDPRILRLFGPDPRLGAAMGAIVAVATLVDCHPAELRDPHTLCCQPWGEDTHRNGVPAWHLVLADIRALDRPVPARGSLAVPWTLPADVAAQVGQQLAVSPC